MTCPSSGSPENTDNAAPPGAWGASHGALPMWHVLILWWPVGGMRLGEQALERRQPLPEKVPERLWEGRVRIQPDFPPGGPDCAFPDSLVVGR